jgi:hypothetical protein
LAITSSCIEAGWRDKIIHFRKTESEYFSRRGVTVESILHRIANIRFFRTRGFGAPANRPQHLQTSARAGESVRVSVIAGASEAIQKSGRERKAGLLRRERASQ